MRRTGGDDAATIDAVEHLDRLDMRTERPLRELPKPETGGCTRPPDQDDGNCPGIRVRGRAVLMVGVAVG